MEQAIVRHTNGSGGVAPLEFNPAQLQMIRDTYANGASEEEFGVLMEIAKARRLNPFLRQIHFVKRRNRKLNRDVWAAQASIDGLRATAQRTGMYQGQDEPEYSYDSNGKLECAKVRVYRKDWGNRAAVGVAFYSEYVQKDDGRPNSFWSEKPHVMLSKCAEALALRKAFPEDMGGLYIPEEMGEPVALQAAQELPRISPHGEVIESEVYISPDDADCFIRGIEECETLTALARFTLTVDELERYHPDDRRRIGAAAQRRKRELSKPDRDLDTKAKAAQQEDDLT